MDFALTDEQRMLEETLTRLVTDQVSPEQRRAMLAAAPEGASPLWRTFAELGLLHMPFSEDVGGLGGDGTDLMIIMQALGRGLVPEAYLAGLVLPGQLLALTANSGQQTEWLTPLLEGEHQLAFAWQEHNARYDALAIATQATQQDGQWQLTGKKNVVLNLEAAAASLVTARLDNAKLGLFIVPANAPGTSTYLYRTIDDQPAGDLTLDNVTLPPANCLSEDVSDALAEVLALGRAALCAQAIGAMEEACDQTLAYLKERKQFGLPLSTFQALQHRMVDMHLHLEQSRSMAILAATSLTLPASERDYKIAAAKAYCGESARFIAEQAIQLHGAMGMTEECYVASYAKHLVMFDHYFGDSDYHLETVSELLTAA
ncbi:acyl-CoA dehydrogenase family protein [Halomonas sp. ISL-60]|uniref:acyl-CoA dehydrogenase family protein n=1 Tax=Halomonas sp. ISL-56 TaxID=2819149 RepID=UPI001BED21FE|nr:acyl-CoA dehydrogenase [Halomonas sp. ISL-56]MBT2775034.1 acyl-CoA dehydrogenase family protein [Halomonas sp. ISL-60]MBT2800055.1 acyl-CoA dehydrogenase family protein [Halomonas sp. ISL-56]